MYSVRVVEAFSSSDAEDLQLSIGDTVIVTDDLVYKGWLKGHKESQTFIGTFPTKYVKRMAKDEAENVGGVDRNAQMQQSTSIRIKLLVEDVLKNCTCEQIFFFCTESVSARSC